MHDPLDRQHTDIHLEHKGCVHDGHEVHKIIATIVGTTVGSVIVAPRPIHEPELTVDHPSLPMVYQLYVDSQMRRKGIGTILMDAAENFARSQGSNSIGLCVVPDNHAARQLYAARGYKILTKNEVISYWNVSSETGMCAESVSTIPMRKDLGRSQARTNRPRERKASEARTTPGPFLSRGG